MLVFGGNAEAAKCTSSLFSAHGALLQWSQAIKTANVDRENTHWLQIQRKCAQTLFSVSHNVPSTKIQKSLREPRGIKSIITRCPATGSSSKLSSCQSSGICTILKAGFASFTTLLAAKPGNPCQYTALQCYTVLYSANTRRLIQSSGK